MTRLEKHVPVFVCWILSAAAASAQDVYRAPDGTIILRDPTATATRADDRGPDVYRGKEGMIVPKTPGLLPAESGGKTGEGLKSGTGKLPLDTAAPPRSVGRLRAQESSGAQPRERQVAVESSGSIHDKLPPNAITFVHIHNPVDEALADVPISFGQVFAPGDLKADAALSGRLESNKTIPLQLDVKATHADGSVRHAIISGIVPDLPKAQALKMALLKGPSVLKKPGPALTIADLNAAGFSASLKVSMDGKQYTASAANALRNGETRLWIDGTIAREWIVTAPLITGDGAAHPHLHARYSVRAFKTLSDLAKRTGKEPQPNVKIRVDIAVENNWAYEQGPKNLTYDAALELGGKIVFKRDKLVHFHHARWRQILWSSAMPEIIVTHDPAYLISTKAVPNYDQKLKISPAAIEAWKKAAAGTNSEPMAAGLATRYMPTTGARGDIGLLPSWTAAYVLSANPAVKLPMMATADLSGSWPIHYRDRRTGQPVSLLDFPYMGPGRASHPGDHINPKTNRSEAFAPCNLDCETPFTSDTSHQPSLNYVPYLLTGDYYHLEELQFWTQHNLSKLIPGYRDAESGLFKGDQVRGQAWSLRTLAQAAYITPDNDRLKSQFTNNLAKNLEFYNKTYTENPSANKLGIITNGYAIEYGGNTGIAPWQDDFFTQAIGFAAGLGFAQAQPLLSWKAKFVNGRLTDPEFCYILAASFSLKVRDRADTAIYNSFKQLYEANLPGGQPVKCGSTEMAAALRIAPGSMGDYPDSATGTAAILQAAIAYSIAATRTPDGSDAWTKFNTRTIKPDYSANPQYAIIPR